MLCHPPRDHGVVTGGVLKGPCGQQSPLGERRTPAADRGQKLVVLIRMGHNCRKGMVFGGGPHEARAADVDQFDRLRRRGAGLGDHALEGVEIHNHRLELLDAVVGQHGQVVGAIAAGENAGEDVGMERLHAAVEHLGKARDRRDIFDVEPMSGERCGGATGAGHTNAGSLEARSQPVDAGLVEHAHEHPAYGHTIGARSGLSGAIRRSVMR